jgi:hypothetical protein
LKRYEEAEAVARAAYQLDAINPTVRYLLSRIWAAEGRDDPEVFEMLRASRRQFPQAHLILASLLLKHGATDDAISELREYLKRPDARDKDKVALYGPEAQSAGKDFYMHHKLKHSLRKRRVRRG